MSLPCSCSSCRTFAINWSTRPGGRRLKSTPALPAGFSPAAASSWTAAVLIAKSRSSVDFGTAVRPRMESRNPTGLAAQLGFHRLEACNAVLQGGMGREDLAERFTTDCREEHQGAARLHLAQVRVGDALHPAADLEQSRRQLRRLAGDDGRAAVGCVLAIA